MPIRVLVVEDDLDIRELLCEYFRGRGWEAVEAGTVREGLLLLPEVDALVVDQRLPDQDGCAIVRAASGKTTLAITAFPSVEETVELMQAGAFALLQKPFRLREVYERLQEGLRNPRPEAVLAWLEAVILTESREELDRLAQRKPARPSCEKALEEARKRLC